jgi:hypothetical protein
MVPAAVNPQKSDARYLRSLRLAQYRALTLGLPTLVMYGAIVGQRRILESTRLFGEMEIPESAGTKVPGAERAEHRVLTAGV